MPRSDYYRSLFDDIEHAQDLARFIRENTQVQRMPDGRLPVGDLQRIGQTCIRPAREALRRYYAEHPDPFRESLRSAPRSRCEDVLEAYVTEYGFLPAWADNATDAEIDEYIDSLRMEVRSPYDCSGQRFTHYIEWKRTPAGVRYIHKTGLDL